MDLSQLSTDDLQALKSGDISKVSSVGLRYLKSAQTREAIDNDAISQGARNFNADSSFAGNALAGIGRGMASVGRGLGGMVGLVDQGQVDEAKRLDAPLMATAGGKVGNMVGNAAAAAPLVLVPGANTLGGAALAGAAFGGATTEGGAGDRLAGAGWGAAGGAGGVALGKGFAALAGRNQASVQASQVANSGRDAAAAQARQAGYVLPPTEVNPNLLTTMLEGFSGKIKTSQAASAKNQPVTNRLAQQELGLPAAPITQDALNAVRAQAGKAYDAVAQAGTITPTAAYDAALTKIVQPYVNASKGFPNAKPNPIIAEVESLRSPQFDAASAVDKIKELRATATAAYAKGEKDTGKALKSAADAIENEIDAHLVGIGAPPDVLKNFREARQLIAKTYSVEKALNPTTGDVSATVLAGQLAKGKPLSGNLLAAAQAGQAFPKATQALKQNYNAVSPLDFAAGGFGVGTGNPLLAAAMAARPAVRSGILSSPFQAAISSPAYRPNRLLEMLAENPALPILGMSVPAKQ